MIPLRRQFSYLLNQLSKKYTTSIEPIKITAIILSFICSVGMAFEPKPIQRLLLDMRATNQFRVRLAPESITYNIIYPLYSVYALLKQMEQWGKWQGPYVWSPSDMYFESACQKVSPRSHVWYIHVCNYELASPFYFLVRATTGQSGDRLIYVSVETEAMN